MNVIPGPARGRLLQLMKLLEKQGAPLSSARLEELTGWHSHTIRKDVSFLAEHSAAEERLGGSNGYDPAVLVPAIRQALGLGRPRKCCVVGLGRLGSSFLDPGMLGTFSGTGFEFAAGFDTNVNRVEILSSPAPLYPAYKMAEVIGRFGIELALLCVPPAAAQDTAEKLITAGIRGILNFAPVTLRLAAGAAVRNVFVADELRELAINIKDV